MAKKWWKCPDCKDETKAGSKFIPGLGFVDCKTCKGQGKVFWSQGDRNGYGYAK